MSIYFSLTTQRGQAHQSWVCYVSMSVQYNDESRVIIPCSVIAQVANYRRLLALRFQVKPPDFQAQEVVDKPLNSLHLHEKTAVFVDQSHTQGFTSRPP